MKSVVRYKILFIILCFFSSAAIAQRPNVMKGIGNRVQGMGGRSGGGGGQDSLGRRSAMEDSITIRFYYIDSTRAGLLDSSVTDFTTRYPIPATHIYLGNTGSATRSILFGPPRTAGFDPGFHAYDVYKIRLENVRFYNTTRPYTELNYIIASRAEQNIDLLHTQNLRPFWNASFQYRLFNAPGTFKNQKSNHNNYLFTSWYESPKKRYNNYFFLLGNKLQAEESGGINTVDLEEPDFARDRYLIPTKMGSQASFNTNPFSTNLTTGNQYKEFNAVLRQQYDLGKKDSIVTDSTVIPLFYPRIRFEHTLRYGKYNYEFRDYTPDTFYKYNYDTTMVSGEDTFLLRDIWKEFSNDFSIYQYPDAKNLHQFIKVGAEFQLLKGKTQKSRPGLHNLIGHGEYRNRTRNGKWDMLAFGKLFMNGYNAGDYHGYISLQRVLSARLGSLQAGFENINRSPFFTYDTRSSFYIEKQVKSFNKENTAHFFATINNDRLRLRLSGDYYLVSNYLYLEDYYKLQQEDALFNVLRVSARKTFRLAKNINWHAEVYIQQKTGNVPVNLPLFYTRNRIAYEGNLGFRNLNLATGFEVRYHAPYKADNYSPVLGRFFYQNTVTISNLPDVHAFMHFRIRSFKGFIRMENLNTARLLDGNFGFTNNNLAAPDYPTPGLYFRFGIFWSFIN